MRAALAVYRRRGSSGRRCDGCRRCPMAGVAPDGRCRAAHRIVDGTPVRRLDVQPGLVVGKSRLVAQLLSLWNGAGGSPAVGWLRRGEQGEAQRQGASRRFEVSLSLFEASEPPARAGLPGQPWLALRRECCQTSRRRPCRVRCFEGVALGRPTESSEAERKGQGTPWRQVPVARAS